MENPENAASLPVIHKDEWLTELEKLRPIVARRPRQWPKEVDEIIIAARNHVNPIAFDVLIQFLEERGLGEYAKSTIRDRWEYTLRKRELSRA